MRTMQVIFVKGRVLNLTATRTHFILLIFRNSFPSKNKLYDHLKTTGHAVFLPTTAIDDTKDSKTKNKKKKKN